MIIIMVMDKPLREGLGILLEDTNSITGNVFAGWEGPACSSWGTNGSWAVPIPPSGADSLSVTHRGLRRSPYGSR